jgi:hypothetical protein
MKLDTDKFESGYIPTYEALSRTMPPDPAICELGVFRGGSLELWQTLFPNASVIVGVDINPGATWPKGTVKVVADQQSPTLVSLLDEILAKEVGIGRKFNLIVDDASHLGHQTYRAFNNLWPLVAPGGYYVIEDWCVGFDTYPQYDDSMLSMAMSLLNRFSSPDTDLHFVTYQYGMIVLRKK